MNHYEIALTNLHIAEQCDDPERLKYLMRLAHIHSTLAVAGDLAAMVEELAGIRIALQKIMREVRV